MDGKQKGNLRLVELVIEAIYKACESGNEELLDFSLKEAEEIKKLFSGCSEKIEEGINKGIIISIDSKNDELIEKLFSNGADPERSIEEAIEKGTIKSIVTLLELGVKVTMKHVYMARVTGDFGKIALISRAEYYGGYVVV